MHLDHGFQRLEVLIFLFLDFFESWNTVVMVLIFYPSWIGFYPWEGACMVHCCD